MTPSSRPTDLTMAVLESVGVLGGLAVALTSLLAVAGRVLHVEEDPRIDDVEELLPSANCGACGYPGCRPFAEALVQGETSPARCSVSDDAGRERIAAYLGVAVGAAVRRVARLACAGGANVARQRARYRGLSSCAAAATVAGGGKGCFWGCLGVGDCEVACDFDAISMNAHGLPVVDEEKCTACGDCVDACPKNLFSIHDVESRLWVACSATVEGDAILEECEVACTTCGRCAMDAPRLVTMRGGLPVVDESLPADDAAIQRCPTGAIVWIDARKGPVRGPSAPRIVREGARPAAST